MNTDQEWKSKLTPEQLERFEKLIKLWRGVIL